MILDSDQEIEGLSAGRGNRVRTALVESAGNIDEVGRESKTVENTQLKWWTLALPACVFIVMGAVFFLKFLGAPKGEGEKSRAKRPVLLQASTSSKRSADKLSGDAVVSSIAYSKTNAIAFINDQMASEGDVIDGLTVLKISKNAVEFEKNGKRWNQEVGEQRASPQ